MNSRILPSLALLVSIGIFFGYVNPTWNGSISTTKKAITADDQALSAAGDYTKRQNELASARNAIDPQALSRLDAFLPDSVDNVGLILDLNALAARAGLSLSNIDVAASTKQGSSAGTSAQTAPAGSAVPGSSGQQSPIGSVDLTLSALGTYSGLQTFLTGVEQSERLLDVRDLVVKGSDTGVYTYQMTVRLYWLR